MQYILDKLSPTLRLLEVLRLFESNEVKAIVKKTTEYEYIMKRRQLDLVNVYEYIQYELNLDKLRSIRSKRALEAIEDEEDNGDYDDDDDDDNDNAYDNDNDKGSTHKSKGSSGGKRKMSTSEKKNGIRNVQTAFLRHICYIFERAIRRFTSDMELWTDYIVFLKSNESNGLLNTVFGRAIALHPKNEMFWLQASIHELDINQNTHAARVLLQRSLRTNKVSEMLWLQYFKLELWNSLRVEERESLLGIRNGKKSDASNNNDDNNEDTATASSSSNKSMILDGASLVVFKYALKAVPSPTAHYFLRFYEIAHRVSRDLSRRIESELRTVYSDNITFWEGLVKFRISSIHEDTEDVASVVGDCIDMFAQVESYLQDAEQCVSNKEKCTNLLLGSVELCLHKAYERLEKANFGNLFTITGAAGKKRKSRDGGSSPFAAALKRLLDLLFVCHREEAGCLNMSLSSVHGASSLVSVLLTRHKALQLQEAMDVGAGGLPKDATVDFTGLVEAASRISITYKKSDATLVGIVKQWSRLLSYLLSAAEATESALVISKICLKEAELAVCCEEGSDVLLKALEVLSCSGSGMVLAKTFIESIIKSKYVQADKRGAWCIVYLKTAGGSYEACRRVYEATEAIFARSPALLVSSDLESFHEHYASYLAEQECAGGVGGGQHLFARTVMERLLQAYPKSGAFYDIYERLELGQRQQEAAEHIRWRKAHIV